MKNKIFLVIGILTSVISLSSCNFLPGISGNDKPTVRKDIGSPVLVNDQIVEYGLYPNECINDQDLIERLDNLDKPYKNDWYLYNSEFFVRTIAYPAESIYKFENGDRIDYGSRYWFRCDPIRWKVLSYNGEDYYLISEDIIDTYNFGSGFSQTIDGETIYSSNYEYSDVRAWLNNSFFETAFYFDKNPIQYTYVDNSASTAPSSTSAYLCNDTDDYVFLPSYSDLINVDYGFPSSINETEARTAKVSDWARATGSKCEEINDNLYLGYYWSRSPCTTASNYVTNVNYNGYIGSNSVSAQDSGVRPAIVIKF